MCDEYDEERMRAFWRQLAAQERLADLDEKPDLATEPFGKTVDEIVPLERRKARILTR